MKYEVNPAELKVSNNPDDVIVARVVGSCIAVVGHDPVAGVGGILNTMLPNSEVNSKAASSNPLIFVDKGFPHFMIELNAHGAIRPRLVVKVAGAAETDSGQNFYSVGSRNLIALRLIMRKFGMEVTVGDTGGYEQRELCLDVGSGRIWTVSSKGESDL
jgi:chemotaxis protein CheD